MQSVALTPDVSTLAEVMNAAHRVMPSDWTPATKTRVRSLCSCFLETLRKLRGAVAGGDPGKIRVRTYQALKGFPGRFCAYLLAYPKNGKPLTLADVELAAASMNLWRPSGESVRVFAKQKNDGGTRPVVSFGPRARAGQRLAREVLLVVWGGPSEFEYSRRDRGRDAALRETLSAFKKRGARHFVAADVKDFHPSFNKGTLTSLIPLPGSVIRNTLLIPDETKIIFHVSQDDILLASETQVRAGLPQGSSCSVLIASKLLEPVLAQLPCRSVVCHGDNLIIGVRTAEEAELAKSTLASLLSKHPAGPFELKYRVVFKPEDHVDLMGYRLRYREKKYGGYARVVPSREAIVKFQTKLTWALMLTPDGTWSEEIEKSAIRWRDSFGAWTGRELGLNYAVIDALARVPQLATSARKVLGELSFKGDLSDLRPLFVARFRELLSQPPMPDNPKPVHQKA